MGDQEGEELETGDELMVSAESRMVATLVMRPPEPEGRTYPTASADTVNPVLAWKVDDSNLYIVIQGI